MFTEFHFLEPLWLLALIPLSLLLWLAYRPANGDSAWDKICDAHLLPLLLVHRTGKASRLPLWLLAAGWLISTLALADPVWDKQLQPVFHSLDSRVVVMDLSHSMLTPDLAPSRLARARYKVADILKSAGEGQIGLVVFASDAFTVSPLTQDAATISSMLAALDPGIMPVQGSRADLGLLKAEELLKQAGQRHGEVLLIADGFEDRRALDAARRLRADGYSVSVLGVGTEAGAPLPSGRGDFLKDAAGNIIVAKLDTAAMRQLANAGGGRYASISVDDSDLNTVLTSSTARLDTQIRQAGFETQQWRERGPWLVLLLVPLGALAFRRGWLLTVAVTAGFLSVSAPQPALALSWDDLWQRQDQQAAQALATGDLQRAAALADDPMRKGTAQYRSGDYQQALQSFSAAQGSEADYNRANALARLGRYEDAVAAYDKALEQQPEMEDAAFNKALVEKLLHQQQEQEKQQQDQENKKQNQGQSQQQKQQSGQGQQDQQAQDQQNQPADDARQAEHENGNNNASQSAPENAQKEAENNKNRRADAAVRKQDEATGQEAQAQTQTEPLKERETEELGQDAVASADDFSSEQQQAVEQWLRRIPDDPGGLLRRKFLYQYQQRGGQSGNQRLHAW